MNNIWNYLRINSTPVEYHTTPTTVVKKVQTNSYESISEFSSKEQATQTIDESNILPTAETDPTETAVELTSKKFCNDAIHHANAKTSITFINTKEIIRITSKGSIWKTMILQHHQSNWNRELSEQQFELSSSENHERDKFYSFKHLLRICYMALW